MTSDRDPFALAREDEDDAELFALIEEYRRRNALAEERGIDDDERDRRCDAADEILSQINDTRPVTLPGVLAVLDLGGEIEDPHHWPEEAIEGLRAIVLLLYPTGDDHSGDQGNGAEHDAMNDPFR